MIRKNWKFLSNFTCIPAESIGWCLPRSSMVILRFSISHCYYNMVLMVWNVTVFTPSKQSLIRFLYIHLGRIVMGKKFPNIATLTTYTKKKNIESIYEYKANEVITNLQEPVNGKKQTDVFDRKACSCKNQEHSDETCTGYAGSSNTR